MASLDGCSAEQLDALVVLTARLKHDLGKYIRFRQGWLADDASLAERREALIADVHHTRRGPDGTVDAARVWAEFRSVLLDGAPHEGHSLQLDDPRVEGVDTAMRELAALEPLGAASEADVSRAAALCAEVARAIRELALDVRVRARGEG